MAVTPVWYLSGGASNSDPAASIGGVKSSVAVSASKLNNLFDDNSGEEAAAGRTEYRCLYVENTGTTDWVDPVMWVVYQPRNPNSPYTPSGETIEFGMSAQGKNATATAIGDDHTSAPGGVSFDDPASKGAGLTLSSPDYAQGDYIGVWFKRTVPSSQAYSTGTDFSVAIEGDDA